MRQRNRPAALLAALIVVLAVVPAAAAEEGEEAGNNLSVPAIFVPDTGPFTVVCDGEPAPVAGDKGVEIAPDVLDHTDYYVQGVATWQGACETATATQVMAAAAWGDNLENAPLKQGTPIRTEIGFLTTDFGTMPGYAVVKLDPNLLDRESHYGTLGVLEDFAEVRVWAAGVTLTIVRDDGLVVTEDELFSAEINSTGRIVYGFNWQKPLAGDYTISVYAGGIELMSTDAGVLVDSDGDGAYDTVELDVTVGNKGSKGNGGDGGKPGDKPGHGGGGQGPKGPRVN